MDSFSRSENYGGSGQRKCTALGFCQDERYLNVSVDLLRLLKDGADLLGCSHCLRDSFSAKCFLYIISFYTHNTLSGWFLTPVLGNLSKIIKPIGDRARIKI